MQHTAIVYVNPKSPEPIGFSTAAGLPGDFRFYFKQLTGPPHPTIASYFPQMVLRPFHNSGSFGYDINIDDVPGGSGLAQVPGPVMNDEYTVEIYLRNSIGQPTWMMAQGRVDLTGRGYAVTGPLGPMTYPVIPGVGEPGPAGPPGPSGERGSRWFSGPGLPSIDQSTLVEGDMWLNETNGDVWRWSGTSLMWVRA